MRDQSHANWELAFQHGGGMGNVVRVGAYTGWFNWDDGLEKGGDGRMKEMEGTMEAKGLIDRWRCPH